MRLPALCRELLLVCCGLAVGAVPFGCSKANQAKDAARNSARSAALDGINNAIGGGQSSGPKSPGNECKSMLVDDIKGACTATLDLNEDAYVWTVTKAGSFEIRALQPAEQNGLAPEIGLKSGHDDVSPLGHTAPTDREAATVYKLSPGTYELDVRATKNGSSTYELTVTLLGDESACLKLGKRRADCDRAAGDGKHKEACRAAADDATRTGDEYKCRDALAGWSKTVAGN